MIEGSGSGPRTNGSGSGRLGSATLKMHQDLDPDRQERFQIGKTRLPEVAHIIIILLLLLPPLLVHLLLSSYS
jgi:hypothetical protein